MAASRVGLSMMGGSMATCEVSVTVEGKRYTERIEAKSVNDAACQLFALAAGYPSRGLPQGLPR